MELLPLEILYKISDYLSLLDHYRLFSTCKSLHRRFFFYIGRRYPNNQEHFVLLINLNRHKELKYLLKARNIDINQNCFYMDEWDEFSPALSWAGHQGFEETLDLIMQDSRLSIVDDGSYCIVYASMNGHTSIVKKLLQNRDRAYDPGALNNYAIKYACQNGHFEIVRMLLEDSRVDPKGALLYSLDYGHLDITFMILNRGRLVPGELTECFQRACETHCYELVERLLFDPRVDPTANDNIVLKRAMEAQDHRLIQMLSHLLEF